MFNLDYLTLMSCQMGQVVPKVNDEGFSIEAAERTTYWCNLAMVRADYQNKGIAKAMFELAYKEVRTSASTSCETYFHISLHDRRTN